MNEVGEMRASQLIYTFGIGAVFDLPRFSALVLGLEDWDVNACEEVQEDRLLGALQKRLGGQLKSLRLPPLSKDGGGASAAGMLAGVPVAAFPRWMRCPSCHMLAPVESGVFTLHQIQDRPDYARYIHASCPKGTNPAVISVRFMLACREGHLTDFPWVRFVHGKNLICATPQLVMHEFGATGDASDVKVECTTCKANRRMSDAFDPDRFKVSCPGHHPHLRRKDKEICKEEAKTMLLGASNSWFPVTMSALHIPRREDELARAIRENWPALKDIPSLEVSKYITAPVRMPVFTAFTPEQVWAAIETAKQPAAPTAETEDLKIAEWEVLSKGKSDIPDDDFTLSRVPAPKGFEGLLEDTILVERLREVRALIGFTRVESNGDFEDVDLQAGHRLTPLAREPLRWTPVAEVRGEGIFLRFREDALQAWESRKDVLALRPQYEAAHRVWRSKRNQSSPSSGFPGMRFLMMHSFSHALMRQIALDCGYGSTSLRERIYCRLADEEHGPMAGVLIYTSASDSEGTLGGVVALGRPDTLGFHIEQALKSMEVCASDPLCSEHTPEAEGRGIHGASCHACLFAAETSCEKGNRYLDRNLLVETFADRKVGFFGGRNGK